MSRKEGLEERKEDVDTCLTPPNFFFERLFRSIFIKESNTFSSSKDRSPFVGSKAEQWE